ncbi:unnamed protein product, partial [Discosporangium mesarthrocarpum]
MSRSALERQASRAVRAGLLPAPSSAPVSFVADVDDLTGDREVKNDELPIHGNDRTYNLNTLLAQTILESDYFRTLTAISSYEEVVDEIYSYVEHVAPWAPGTSRVPSSAFCLLMKLFVTRLTGKQMDAMLMHQVRP